MDRGVQDAPLKAGHPGDGFAPIVKTEVVLVASPEASPATLRLADRLAEFCGTVQAKAA
jgi:hypothetical protein